DSSVSDSVPVFGSAPDSGSVADSEDGDSSISSCAATSRLASACARSSVVESGVVSAAFDAGSDDSDSESVSRSESGAGLAGASAVRGADEESESSVRSSSAGLNWNLLPPQSGQPDSICFEPSGNVCPHWVHWWGMGSVWGVGGRKGCYWRVTSVLISVSSLWRVSSRSAGPITVSFVSEERPINRSKNPALERSEPG